jgi:hypothetical protein
MGVDEIVRVHADPLYLPRPPLDPPGENRFDDPTGQFVVRYTGATLYACLVESMAWARREDVEAELATVAGIDPADRDPSMSEGIGDWLGSRKVARFTVVDDRSVLDVNDAGLLAQLDKHPLVRQAIEESGLGTPLEPQHLDEALIRLSGPTGRRITKAVSRAVYEWHPDAELLGYCSRHDDQAKCYAVFPPALPWDATEVRQLDPARAEDRDAVQQVAGLFEIDLPDNWR